MPEEGEVRSWGLFGAHRFECVYFSTHDEIQHSQVPAVAGLKANAGPIPYSASKAAVISMAQTAAYALTGLNIRVNAVCPGLIEVSSLSDKLCP